MEILYPRCYGLDVHKKSVLACLIIPEGKEVRTFASMTKELLELANWLAPCKMSHVVMERALMSTGITDDIS